jgi:hypothetical protein
MWKSDVPRALFRYVALSILSYSLGVSALRAQSVSQADRRVLTGSVTSNSGEGIPYAYLYESASGTSAVSNSSGVFKIVLKSPASCVSLRVRRLGYAPFDTTFSTDQSTEAIQIRLSALSSVLDTVTVRARSGDYDEYLDRHGFYRRVSRAADATFISASEIERRNALDFSSIVRNVPGVRVISRPGKGGKNSFVLGRGGLCSLGLVIDGQRVEVSALPIESLQPRITSIMGGKSVQAIQSRQISSANNATIDELVPPSMLAGIEVYPSATSVPNELQHHVDGCGLLVVWTRFQ